MLATERGFLQAITEEPDDDGLRLIFADWLEDHGKPAWAALIRRQIRYAPRDPDDLHRRWSLDAGFFVGQVMPEELTQIEAEMAYPVPLKHASFQRGLVEHLPLPSEMFLSRAKAMADWGPMPTVQPSDLREALDRFARWQPPSCVIQMSLTQCKFTNEELRRWVDTPLFRQLAGIHLPGGQLTNEAPFILAAAGPFPDLRRLELPGLPMTDAGLLHLATTGTFPQLTWLSLSRCRITGHAFENTGSENLWPNLNVLDLSWNPLHASGANAIAISPQLAPIRRLRLNSAQFTDDAAVLLGQSPHPMNLRELNLRSCPVSDEGLHSLTQSPALARLRRLDLASKQHPTGPRLSPRQAASLSQATFADTLEELDLRYQPIGTEGVLALAESGRYQRLKKLNVSNCEIGPAGARSLIAWLRQREIWIDASMNPFGPDGVTLMLNIEGQRLKPVRRIFLNLDNMNLGDAGIDLLVTRPELSRVYYLEAMENNLTGEGIARLVASPASTGLERLNLGINPVGDTGAAALATSPHLAGLQILELGTCELTDVGVVALADSSGLGSLRELVLFDNALTDVSADALLRWPSAALTKVHLDRNSFSVSVWVKLAERFGEGLVAY